MPLVWHVSREYAGIAEAGGVKDVVRGLAEAHARAGGASSVVMPLYGFVSERVAAGTLVASFTLSLPDQDVHVHGRRRAGEPLEEEGDWSLGFPSAQPDPPAGRARDCPRTRRDT
ncbi:MAG: glycogen/starch synthase [Spirochaetia bacterium]